MRYMHLRAEMRFAKSALLYVLQFHCWVCRKRFTAKSDVIFHLRVEHDIGEQVRCDVCSETDFSCEADYNKHVEECTVSQSLIMLITAWALGCLTAADANAFSD